MIWWEIQNLNVDELFKELKQKDEIFNPTLPAQIENCQVEVSRARCNY